MRKPLLLTVAFTLLLAPRTLHAHQETAPPPPATSATPAAPPAKPAISEQEIALLTEKAMATAMSALDGALTTANGKIQNVFYAQSGLSNAKVSLDVNDTSVKDALKRVLEQAKLDYVLDDDIPDVKTSVKVKDVSISTVLDLLTQTAGVGWRSETSVLTEKGKDEKTPKRTVKTVVRVGKKVTRSLFTSLNGMDFGPGAHGTGTTRVFPATPGVRVAPSTARTAPQLYRYSINERRSNFTCPHCKGQATIVRNTEAPHCSTCNRLFQADWKVCPYDGAKRPVTQNTWKFCPICGKEVPQNTVLQQVDQLMHIKNMLRPRIVDSLNSVEEQFLWDLHDAERDMVFSFHDSP